MEGTNVLDVTVKADGLVRHFSASGDGAAVVAAFRVWLASPDFWLPMATGADQLDATSAEIATRPIRSSGLVERCKSALMAEAFVLPDEFSLARLLPCMRQVKDATALSLRQAVNELAADGKITSRIVGRELVYRVARKETAHAS